MLLEAAHERRVVRVACAGAGIDHDVDRRQLMLMETKRFTDDALDAIAAYGVADHTSGDRETEPRKCAAVQSHEHRERAVGRAACIAIDAVEF